MLRLPLDRLPVGRLFVWLPAFAILVIALAAASCSQLAPASVCNLDAPSASAAGPACAEQVIAPTVALNPPTVNYIPLEEATQRLKTVPPDCDTIMSAREMAICFGD